MSETKNVVKKTSTIKKTSVTKGENIINEIEKILGGSGYIKLILPALPGECKVAYVKGTRIIVISDTSEANDMQIQSIHNLHKVELSIARDRAKDRIKNIPGDIPGNKKKGDKG